MATSTRPWAYVVAQEDHHRVAIYAIAAEGTVRKKFAESIERNCAHGSDAPETAAVETVYYFPASELL